MAASRFVVGIDLGTTNSALAYYDAGLGDKAVLTHLKIPQVVAPGVVEDRPLLPSFLYLPGPGEQPNLGVSDLALGSPMMSVGVAARFSVEATNYGREEVRNVTVGLSIDGGAPSDEAVIDSIPAGARSGKLRCRFERATPMR